MNAYSQAGKPLSTTTTLPARAQDAAYTAVKPDSPWYMEGNSANVVTLPDGARDPTRNGPPAH
jgi:hypothetical protein